MSSVLLALVAHAGNALVFVVDKSLLSRPDSKIGKPLTYAFYSALLAGAAIVILPFSYAPLAGLVFKWSVLAGLLHIIALWLFFTALKSGEPSRVVPIAGSAVPLFTLLLAVIWLGESLMISQWLAIGLLIAGGVLLSIRLSEVRGLASKALIGAVISGAFFAGYFVVMKYVYEQADTFLATFVYSRVIEAGLALVTIGPFLLMPRVWSRQSLMVSYKQRVSHRVNFGSIGLLVPVIFISNKVLAAGAFLLQNYAISLGSVTIVNALQGTQYAILLLLAVLISKWWPKLFQEELRRVALTQKIAGIALISLALIWLV